MTGPTTTVYLVRHGETDWNASGRCQGSSDVPMNATGIEQVMLLRAELGAVPFDMAYTSPLSRARQTAELLLGDSGTRPVELAALAELSYGSYQGKAAAEWQGDAAARWTSDPWSLTFPLGESLAELRHRSRSAMAAILTGAAGRSILVSGHGHANRLVIMDALELEPHSFWDIAQPNAAAYRIDYLLNGAGGWAARSATRVGGARTGETVERRVVR